MEYQQRVLSEREELAVKVGKLDTFLMGQTFPTLTEQEQFRLRVQSLAMKTYLAALKRG